MIIQGATLSGVTVRDATLYNSGNMLLYLDAANSTSYPGSGTTWYDLSGRTNNTTGTSNTTYSTNNGGYFNFVDPGWFTTNSSKYNVTYTGKTIFMAAKLASAMSSSTYRCMFGSNGGNRNFNLYFYYTGSAYQLHFSSAGQGGLSSSMSYTPGNWGTFAITQTTGGVLTYYYNGVQLGTAQTGVTFSQYLSTTSENVGASDNYWNGPISVTAIYGSALTADQILQNHNAVRIRYGLS